METYLAFIAYKAYRQRAFPQSLFIPSFEIFRRMIANNPAILAVYRKEGLI